MWFWSWPGTVSEGLRILIVVIKKILCKLKTQKGILGTKIMLSYSKKSLVWGSGKFFFFEDFMDSKKRKKIWPPF